MTQLFVIALLVETVIAISLRLKLWTVHDLVVIAARVFDELDVVLVVQDEEVIVIAELELGK